MARIVLFVSVEYTRLEARDQLIFSLHKLVPPPCPCIYFIQEVHRMDLEFSREGGKRIERGCKFFRNILVKCK